MIGIFIRRFELDMRLILNYDRIQFSETLLLIK